jgi:hypothetical protein
MVRKEVKGAHDALSLLLTKWKGFAFDSAYDKLVDVLYREGTRYLLKRISGIEWTDEKQALAFFKAYFRESNKENNGGEANENYSAQAETAVVAKFIKILAPTAESALSDVDKMNEAHTAAKLALKYEKHDLLCL